MTAQLVAYTPNPSRLGDQRRCDFDRLGDVDLELGRRVRDALVAENLAGFLPDPAPELIAAARTCSGTTVAGRAVLAGIRGAWTPGGEATS